MKLPSGARYLIVGGLCALVHNAIMIGGAALRLHYAASTVVSYVVVVVLGFLLHARFTYSAQPTLKGFGLYAAGAAMNYPFWLLLMFLLYDLGGLPMAIASPLGTVVLTAWNFFVSRWAILRPARPSNQVEP